jgi:hypothetical protein
MNKTIEIDHNINLDDADADAAAGNIESLRLETIWEQHRRTFSLEHACSSSKNIQIVSDNARINMSTNKKKKQNNDETMFMSNATSPKRRSPRSHRVLIPPMKVPPPPPSSLRSSTSRWESFTDDLQSSPNPMLKKPVRKASIVNDIATSKSSKSMEQLSSISSLRNETFVVVDP